MKTYNIASDYPVDAKPNESGAENQFVKTSKGTVSHKDLLGEFRKKPTPRVIHSDGFLAMSGLDIAIAYECECGFMGIFKANKCIRCGTNLEGK